MYPLCIKALYSHISEQYGSILKLFLFETKASISSMPLRHIDTHPFRLTAVLQNAFSTQRWVTYFRHTSTTSTRNTISAKPKIEAANITFYFGPENGNIVGVGTGGGGGRRAAAGGGGRLRYFPCTKYEHIVESPTQARSFSIPASM